MKLLIITFTFVCSFFAKSTLANDSNISPRVLQSFENRFTSANEVSWTLTQNMYKAQFNMNGQFVSAFFKSDGSLVAVTRNINLFQLPVALQADIKKNYDSFWISDLLEVTNDEGTHYYVTLETAEAKVVLKSLQTASWITYHKNKKD